MVVMNTMELILEKWKEFARRLSGLDGTQNCTEMLLEKYCHG